MSPILPSTSSLFAHFQKDVYQGATFGTCFFLFAKCAVRVSFLKAAPGGIAADIISAIASKLIHRIVSSSYRILRHSLYMESPAESLWGYRFVKKITLTLLKLIQKVDHLYAYCLGIRPVRVVVNDYHLSSQITYVFWEIVRGSFLQEFTDSTILSRIMVMKCGFSFAYEFPFEHLFLVRRLIGVSRRVFLSYAHLFFRDKGEKFCIQKFHQSLEAFVTYLRTKYPEEEALLNHWSQPVEGTQDALKRYRTSQLLTHPDKTNGEATLHNDVEIQWEAVRKNIEFCSEVRQGNRLIAMSLPQFILET